MALAPHDLPLQVAVPSHLQDPRRRDELLRLNRLLAAVPEHRREELAQRFLIDLRDA